MMGSDPDETWGVVEIAETLVGRKPGASAAEKARELRSADPVGAVVGRLLRRHTDERAWSRGATGERVTGFFLGRLPTGWHVFHDVPIGDRGANVDHVVIGPGGVFTVNAKNVRGTVTLSARTLRVNGYRRNYLPKAIEEAARAGALLTAALGREVAARRPVLAIIADDWKVTAHPDDVIVGTPRAVKRALLQLPLVLAPRDVVEVAAVAAKPQTWTARRPPSKGASERCRCGGELLVRTRRSDGERFLGCSRFPRCRLTRPIPHGGSATDR